MKMLCETEQRSSDWESGLWGRMPQQRSVHVPYGRNFYVQMLAHGPGVLIFAGTLLYLLFSIGPIPGKALEPEEILPDTAAAEGFIADAPVTPEAFLRNPIGCIATLFTGSMAQVTADQADCLTKLLFLLLLGGAIKLFLSPGTGTELLELILFAATLLSLLEPLRHSADLFVESIEEWQTYLVSFAPVFAGVLAMGGQPTSAMVYNNFFLSVITFLSHIICTFAKPCLFLYSAVLCAGAFCGLAEVEHITELLATLLKKVVFWLGTAFAGLMSLQRTFSVAMDTAAMKAGEGLVGAVPILGQSLSSASGMVYSAALVLRSGLGFAAIAVIAAKFLPLLLQLGVQMMFFHLFRFLSGIFSLKSVSSLHGGAVTALEMIFAVSTLYFSMIVIATALMVLLAGGG